jgi:uncharacterized phage protein (TIGR02218 family)
MMNFPAAFQAHLASGATTTCNCWRVTRKDAVVQGFTDHDVDLTFNGTTFKAASGFTASQINKTLGLSTDNLEVHGALSSSTINEDDLALGKYDDAFVELFWVNWMDVTQFVTRMTGYTGETKRTGVAFTTELRGLTTRLDQVTMRTFKRTCDARVGDARCTVNLGLSTFNGTATITAMLTPRIFQVSGLGAFADGWFAQGTATFTAGSNNGGIVDIKGHTLSTSGVVTLELWFAPAFGLVVGNTMAVRAGCDQTITMCKARFNNVSNFRGFNMMPGNDKVIRNVDPSATNEGSSTTTTSK